MKNISIKNISVKNLSLKNLLTRNILKIVGSVAMVILVFMPSVALSVTSGTTTPSLGVFYYPWCGGESEGWKHWKDHGHNPPTTWFSNYVPDYVNGFFPSKELYSSKDQNVIKWDLGLMKRAGIGFVVSSWWGQNSYEDQSLDIILNSVLPATDNPHKDIKFAIYYEKEGFANVSKDEIVSDINYIKTKYTNSPYYYTVNGRPVVFVYNTASGLFGETGLQEAQKWKQVRDETGIYTVLKVFSGYQNNASLADSWHQYAPTTSYEAQGTYSAFVSPGYDKSNETARLQREDFVRFESDVIKLKNANVQFKLIETWNEWGEGTGIEPAQKINDHNNSTEPFTEADYSYGTKYIDILNKYFNSKQVVNGDINNDDNVTISDALLYLRYSVGQDILPFHIYQTTDDVTCDNTITVADALLVLRKSVDQNVKLGC